MTSAARTRRPRTNIDLSWTKGADMTGTSYEDRRTVDWSREYVERFIRRHHLDPADYFAVDGDQPAYRAWAVLCWLGY